MWGGTGPKLLSILQIPLCAFTSVVDCWQFSAVLGTLAQIATFAVTWNYNKTKLKITFRPRVVVATGSAYRNPTVHLDKAKGHGPLSRGRYRSSQILSHFPSDPKYRNTRYVPKTIVPDTEALHTLQLGTLDPWGLCLRGVLMRTCRFHVPGLMTQPVLKQVKPVKLQDSNSDN